MAAQSHKGTGSGVSRMTIDVDVDDEDMLLFPQFKDYREDALSLDGEERSGSIRMGNRVTPQQPYESGYAYKVQIHICFLRQGSTMRAHEMPALHIGLCGMSMWNP